MRPLRGASSRGGRSGLAAVIRSVEAYFDWHPLMAAVCLLVVLAAGLTLGERVFEAVIPSVGGWALFTPLNGIVLALLLMSRRRLWAWILVGYVIALAQGQEIAGVSHARGFIEIGGNVLEVLIASFCLPPYRNLKQWLLEPRLIPAFAGYAMLLGPLVMSVTVALRYPGTPGSVGDLHAGFWERARIVGFSESLGIALWTPFVLVLCNKQTYQLFRGKALPLTIGMLAMLSMWTWLAFTQSVYPVVFLPYTILVVMAFRQGFRGAVLGMGLSAAIVTALSEHGRNSLLNAQGWWTGGSVIGNTASGQAMLIQSYLVIAVLIVFPLSVTLLKRTELEDRVVGQERELERLKSLDRLTGVANRKRFDLVLTREWQRALRDPKPVALLMVDVDFFEEYNDCYGHQAGDECLRKIANRMADQPHRAYDLVSRYDAGKFTVLLPGAPGEAMGRIAEEFRAEVAAMDLPHVRSSFERITVSVGWASIIPGIDVKPEVLIAASEQALAAAKEKGRNCVEGFSGNAVALN